MKEVVMDAAQAAVLGIVQGLTEFLPISSSGHLLLFPFFAGWKISGSQNIPFFVIVHIGTLVAVLTFFFNDIKLLFSSFIKSIIERRIGDDAYRRLAWFLIIGTIPAGIVFLFISKLLEDSLESPKMVGIFLLVTGVLLILSEKIGRMKTLAKDMRFFDVLFIGFAQGLAILPGISRSGSTIAAGLFRGLTREEAARFSFLLSIPAIIAGALEETITLIKGSTHNVDIAILTIGFITASISGYIAIKYFINYLKKHSLYIFALYCFALGSLTVLLTSLR
ncbi:MAG: undecaprenyl-diphosphate phosphatase [Actinomycetota bacterium]|nr:undecaprenyl-diphosphate phosphatase [Actinomycetota bacterium]